MMIDSAKWDSVQSVVAFGGGHGLGSVLSALSFLQSRLTGIVATTDNGGSTGRLRSQTGCIAWGDLRNCLNQLCDQEPTLSHLLFQYRFNTGGELNGHNLGNLMLLALDQLCVRPLAAVNLIREWLGIVPNIIPMSEEPVSLMAVLASGKSLVGEVEIDALSTMPNQLMLTPAVNATMEAVYAIEKADVLLFGPGSFLSSVMPCLLVDDLMLAIRNSKAKKVLIANLAEEPGPSSTIDFKTKLRWIEQQVGYLPFDVVIWPMNRPRPQGIELPVHYFHLISDNGRLLHHPKHLLTALESVLGLT